MWMTTSWRRLPVRTRWKSSGRRQNGTSRPEHAPDVIGVAWASVPVTRGQAQRRFLTLRRQISSLSQRSGGSLELLSWSAGEPALTVSRRLGVWKPDVCLVSLGRLMLDAGAMPERSLVHGVATPARVRLVLTCADGEDDAGRVSAPDDHVLRLGGAVHEVPLRQRPLLTLDDQQRLAGEDEKVFLIGFPVVHPDRLTRREHIETES